MGVMKAETKLIELRLVSHRQHLELLDALEKRTRVIEIVRICGGDEELIKEATPFLIKKERVNRWHGTIQGGRGSLKYTIRADGMFFEHLRKYDGFFRSTPDKNAPFEVTDFGLDDVAFLDGGGAALFYTTTHEGYAYIDPKLAVALSYHD